MHRCVGCGRRVSVGAGTVFHRTRTPLTVWFEAACPMMASKQGVSALTLQRVTDLGSYQSAWTMTHKLRSVMNQSGRDRLSGRVEMDETFIGGGSPGKSGRGAAGKTLVAGAIERRGTGFGPGQATGHPRCFIGQPGRIHPRPRGSRSDTHHRWVAPVSTRGRRRRRRNKIDDSGRNIHGIIRESTQMTNGHMLESEPEPVVVAPPLRHQLAIQVIEEEKPLQQRPFRGFMRIPPIRRLFGSR